MKRRTTVMFRVCILCMGIGWLTATGGGRGPVPDAVQNGSVDLLSARAALLFLRAGTPAGAQEEELRYAFDRSQAPVNLLAATRILAALSKPVDCSGEFLDGTLVITCKDYHVPIGIIHTVAADMTRWVFDKVERDFGYARAFGVLLADASDSLTLNETDLARFLETYHLP